MGRHWRNVEDDNMNGVYDGFTVIFLLITALVFVAARYL